MPKLYGPVKAGFQYTAVKNSESAFFIKTFRKGSFLSELFFQKWRSRKL